jgi:hypothetical protein
MSTFMLVFMLIVSMTCHFLVLLAFRKENKEAAIAWGVAGLATLALFATVLKSMT